MFDNEYFTQKEVADIIGVKVPTLNHWRCVKRYKIPYVKLGRIILYPKDAFNGWLAKYARNIGTNEG